MRERIAGSPNIMPAGCWGKGEAHNGMPPFYTAIRMP
jgi:hypothetical protein